MKNNLFFSEEDIQAIARESALILDDKKGQEIVLLDLRNVNSYLSYFLIVTGNSLIHCRSLARELQKNMYLKSYKERTRSKLDSGWIILDYNELVIHIFTEEFRSYYQLEKLWADAEHMRFK
ncbi:MAG TPA: ribosome silencing factor [Spirochaetota bacterium]|nr:ribosome silencing factor [Spirochaetota bacterium]